MVEGRAVSVRDRRLVQIKVHAFGFLLGDSAFQLQSLDLVGNVVEVDHDGLLRVDVLNGFHSHLSKLFNNCLVAKVFGAEPIDVASALIGPICLCKDDLIQTHSGFVFSNLWSGRHLIQICSVVKELLHGLKDLP